MKNLAFTPLLCTILFLVACGANTESDTQKSTDGKVSIEQFKAKLATVPSPQLIDVRTPEEFSGGTLDGAVNMNFKSADLESQLNTLDKSKPVFIFCQAGGRSGKCYKKMKDMGFSEVYDMQGGYGSWKNEKRN
ncbi:MAG: rhodanese-like domain-containing protein [Bacteroidota bacterium]